MSLSLWVCFPRLRHIPSSANHPVNTGKSTLPQAPARQMRWALLCRGYLGTHLCTPVPGAALWPLLSHRAFRAQSQRGCLLFTLSPLSFNFWVPSELGAWHPASVVGLSEWCTALGGQAEAFLCVQGHTSHLREPPWESPCLVLPTGHSFLVAGIREQGTPAIVSFCYTTE